MSNGRAVLRLPSFASAIFYERVHCRYCRMKIGEDDLLFVGAGRDKEGNACFSYEFQCPACRNYEAVVDTTHRFTKLEWWNELVAWNDAVPTTAQMAADSQRARRTFPRIGPMVIGPSPLQSVWIRGGYRGEVGPVIFYYEGEGEDATTGFIKLERAGHVTFLDFEDRYCLPRLDLGRFAAVRDGGTFPLDGRDWMKMSNREIEEIIRDRVFKPVVDDQCRSVTTRRRRTRSAHGSTHAKEGRKGTRHSSRDSRPMDS